MTSDDGATGIPGGAAGNPGDTSGVHGSDGHDAELIDVGPAEQPDETEEILSRIGDPGPGGASGTAGSGGREPAGTGGPRASVADLEVSSEEAVAEAVELAQRIERERDDYLDALRRLKADFENYKRRVATQQGEQRAQAALELVRELLPVLDAFDAAVEHGSEEVQPLRKQLIQTLEKQGMEVLSDAGVPFDPNVHEAVMHDEGEGEAVVTEVMRTGYLWNGRVVRAAMVRVRG